MSGPVVRGVIRAETLQRIAESCGEPTAQFARRWPLFAYLHAEQHARPRRTDRPYHFEIWENHDCATRRDQLIGSARTASCAQAAA